MTSDEGRVTRDDDHQRTRTRGGGRQLEGLDDAGRLVFYLRSKRKKRVEGGGWEKQGAMGRAQVRCMREQRSSGKGGGGYV